MFLSDFLGQTRQLGKRDHAVKSMRQLEVQIGARYGCRTLARFGGKSSGVTRKSAQAAALEALNLAS